MTRKLRSRVNPRYAAADVIGVGCAPVTRDDYTDAEGEAVAVALVGGVVGVGSGGCIARPTREGCRVATRPRRTPRGACLGVAKR